MEVRSLQWSPGATADLRARDPGKGATSLHRAHRHDHNDNDDDCDDAEVLDCVDGHQAALSRRCFLVKASNTSRRT
jgi:hypothetical protein